MKRGIKILFILFLLVCIGVHVYGLFVPFSRESLLSHVIHLLSYAASLFFLLRKVPWRVAGYAAAIVYPWVYHALCLEQTYAQHQTVNGVCMLVVILLPAIGVWMLYEERYGVTAAWRQSEK